jgi:hypothetical protein
MFARLIAGLAVGMMASAALATGTVTLYLESPAGGHTIAAGSTVNWTIKVGVSTGDNYGLALLACDLVQAAANPAKFDLPPGTASTIPAEMAIFDRPAGIANPGENGAASGFIGVQRGTAGQKNLIQIGGGQNTFGTAMPAGSGIGENALVSSGIGQGASPQLVLSGSFTAPATQGTYTFSLQNGTANVLTTVGAPPQFSQCSSATIDASGASFTFTVGTAICVGDLNCDGVINFGDINPFVMYLSNFNLWQTTYAGCDPRNGDINCDGTYGAASFADINPFVSIMTQCGSGCTCPGPVTCP